MYETKYKIKDVAKFVGITTEAIRYYENEGIITPIKDKTNGYRYYNAWDVHVLIQARLYRQYGYSINDIKGLINEYSLNDIEKCFVNKENELENALLWNIKLLNYIRKKKALVEEISHFSGKFKVEMRPPLYRMDIQERYSLFNDEEISKMACEILQKTPFLSSSALFKKEDFLNNNERFYFGLSIEEEFADKELMEKCKDVIYYPPCLSIYTVVRTKADRILLPEYFKDVMKYMKDNGLQLAGDVITRVVLYRKEDDIYETITQAWLPIVQL